MHAAEKKLQEKSRMVLRSADDHYNMGIAELNRRQLDAAMQHLQHALKLTPKGDHVLYAMAVVNALKGNRDDCNFPDRSRLSSIGRKIDFWRHETMTSKR